MGLLVGFMWAVPRRRGLVASPLDLLGFSAILTLLSELGWLHATAKV